MNAKAAQLAHRIGESAVTPGRRVWSAWLTAVIILGSIDLCGVAHVIAEHL